MEARLKGLTSSMTNKEAIKEIDELEVEVERLENKLKALSENQELISKEEVQRINTANENAIKMWRKRRRMALDILDAILEGYPKKKSELYEDIGIETDDDAGVSLPKV